MAEELNRQEENTSRALDRPREYPLAQSMSYAYPEEDIHLRDYLQIIMRRRWIVITFLLTVLTTVTIGTRTNSLFMRARAWADM